MTSSAAVPLPVSIDYPSSDGKPMAETDLHRDEMAASIDELKEHLREQPDAYVAGNLFIYYDEGDPSASFAPDVFVVLGVPKRRRRVYKLWEEKKAPSFVLEVSSRKTWTEDEGNKKALCERLGVAEYYLYDPEGDYLDPPLQGFRFEPRKPSARRGRSTERGRYVEMVPDAAGALTSDVLGLRLSIDAGRLRFTDLATGAPLLRPEELAQARREAQAQARRDAAARADAEARADAAEAEIERLRDELARLRSR
jgi:Uma2 family endonuclease